MKTPGLFIVLGTMDVMQLPSPCEVTRSRMTDSKQLCAQFGGCLTVLWSGVADRPTWGPADGSHDRATAVALDLLDRQLALLRVALGNPIEYVSLGTPALPGEEMPARWRAAGAHPLNTNAVPFARKLKAGDSVLLCEWETKQRKVLPSDGPALHGNRRLEAMDSRFAHLFGDDVVPVGVELVLLQLE